FLASTNYGLKSGWLDMSSYDPDLSRSLYLIVLSADDPSPFLLKTGDETVKAEKKEEKSEGDKKVTVKLDVEGITNRILAVDIPAREYTELVAGPENSVFFLESVPNQGGMTLQQYDIAKQEKKEFMG